MCVFHVCTPAPQPRSPAAFLQSLMDQLAHTCEENRVVLYTCLVSHTTAPSLSLAERVVVVQQAAEQGSQQEEAFQLTAISAALSKLPEAWAAAGGASGSGSSELQELRQAILAAVQQVARSVADSAQVSTPCWAGVV
jgi:hypothetical protein